MKSALYSAGADSCGASQALEQALRTAEAGDRLSPEQALALLQEADLLDLGRLAHSARLRHNPEPMVTYVVDRNINTTNICLSGCRFCAFFRAPGAEGGYVLTRAELGQKIDETLALGGTQILMQASKPPARLSALSKSITPFTYMACRLLKWCTWRLWRASRWKTPWTG